MKRTLLLLLLLLLAFPVSLGVMRSGAASAGLAISPEIISFTAKPQVIGPGESAMLAWQTRGATSVAIEWGPEFHRRGAMQKRTGLPPSGTMTVQPEENSLYVLECETAFGQMCMSASVTVRMK